MLDELTRLLQEVVRSEIETADNVSDATAYGNADDTYYAGFHFGRVQLARQILTMVGNSLLEMSDGGKRS